MIDRDGFARALLDVLGAPATPSNVAFLIAWQAREGTKAAFNPLATTLKAPGATIFNSVGVRNYPDLATGVDATRRTLVSDGYYTRIVADLRAGDGLAASQEHDELRTWSGGGYDHIDIGNVPASQPEEDDLTPEQAEWLEELHTAVKDPTNGLEARMARVESTLSPAGHDHADANAIDKQLKSIGQAVHRGPA